MKIKELFSKVGKSLTAGLFGLSSAGVANAVTAIESSAVTATCTVYSQAALNSGNPGEKWNIATDSVYGFDTYTVYTVNGQKAYCVQQPVQIAPGSYDFTDSTSLGNFLGEVSLSSDKAARLEQIAAFGYGYGGDTSPEMDFATQIRIWQEMGLGAVDKVHPDIQAKINQINARLESYDKNISLEQDQETEVGKYTGTYENGQVVLQRAGEEYAAVIHDSTGILEANYSVLSASSGLHVEKLSGDRLKVWVDEGTEFSNENPLTITLGGYFNGNSGSIVYKKAYTQSLCIMNTPTAKQVNIQVVPKPNHTEVGLSTTATSDGIKEINVYDDTTSFQDTVSYTGVQEGYSYTIKGKIMDKKTGKEIEGATAEKTFTPETSDGQITLDFSIDTDKLLDTDVTSKDVVCFEYLYQNTPDIGSSERGKEVANHTQLDDKGQTVTVKQPKIGTQANIDGEKEANTYDEEVTLSDKIAYSNLKVGKEYTAVGTLINKATGKEVKSQTVSKKFTPTSSDGSVAVEFKVNPSTLGDGQYVVYETVQNKNGKKIVNHKDINDAGQTVTVKKATIGTKASIEGDKVINTKDKEVELNDTVSYTNLVVGKKYTLKAKLMDKETGKALDYKATAEFTPTSENGEQEVTFKVNPKDVAGKTLVVYEYLYDQKDRQVAKHEDIEDEGQTVEIRNAEIGTSASIDNKKIINTKDKTVELVDKVSYSGLIVGNTYTVEGMLMDKDTKQQFTDGVTVQVIDKTKSEDEKLNEDVSVPTDEDSKEDSKTDKSDTDKTSDESKKDDTDNTTDEESKTEDKNVSSTKFVADSEDGTVEVKFTIDLSKVSDKSLVVFEKLYDKHGDEITDHQDYEDEQQTVKVPKAKIGTTATINGQKSVLAGETYELVDEVKYEGLIPGKKYTLKGRLMDKSTGKELDSSAVTVETVNEAKESKEEKTDYLEDTSKADSDISKVSTSTETDAEDSSKVVSASYALSYTYDGKTYKIRIKLDEDAIALRDTGKEFVADVTISGPNTEQNGTYQSKFTTETLDSFMALKEKNEEDKPADRLKALNTFISTVFENEVDEDTSKADSKDSSSTTESKKEETTATDSTTASTTTFTPEAESGTITVKFKVNTSKLAGKDLVVFEKLYDEDDDEVSSHEDLNDEGQTVKITSKPNPNTSATITGITALAAVGVASLIGVSKTSKKKDED